VTSGFFFFFFWGGGGGGGGVKMVLKTVVCSFVKKLPRFLKMTILVPESCTFKY
jgi:hypothetical protein